MGLRPKRVARDSNQRRRKADPKEARCFAAVAFRLRRVAPKLGLDHLHQVVREKESLPRSCDQPSQLRRAGRDEGPGLPQGFGAREATKSAPRRAVLWLETGKFSNMISLHPTNAQLNQCHAERKKRVVTFSRYWSQKRPAVTAPGVSPI